jgi:hypothetical protein
MTTTTASRSHGRANINSIARPLKSKTILVNLVPKNRQLASESWRLITVLIVNV